MNIGVACGGTGGHIFPGLAVATVLRRRGHHVTLWLAGRDVEAATLGGWDGATEQVPASGFGSRPGVQHLVAAVGLVRAAALCRRRMEARRPDVLLAMGSYACVGPAVAARLLHVPLVLHEANAVPGRAVALLSRFARAVAVTFQETAACLPAARSVTVTGFPLRPDLAAALASAAGPTDGEGFKLLIMGGSQGARRLNEAGCEAVQELRRAGADLRVVHLAGMREEPAVRERYRAAGCAADVHGFLQDMRLAYEGAALAVSRAGAASCAELAAAGVPALFIPLPAARRNHQEANARIFERAGGADVMLQADLTPGRLAAYVQSARGDRPRLERRRAAMRSLAAPDAAVRVANLVEETP